MTFGVGTTASNASFGLETGDWNSGTYHRFGVWQKDGQLLLHLFRNSVEVQRAVLMPTVAANTWYVLELAVDDAAGFRATVWAESAPSARYEMRWEMPTGQQTWRFHTWGSASTVTSLDNYQEGRPSLKAADVRVAGRHYEYDYAANVQTKRYYAEGMLLATRSIPNANPNVQTLRYVQSDHLGSTSTLTDPSGNVVARERYSAFGERRRGEMPLTTDQLYTGQQYNSLSGLYHYSDGKSAGRFYDPLLARFVMADSITPGNGSIALNRYAYSYNNPVAFIDPDGHCAFGSDGNISRSDCSVQEFEALKPEQRIQWMQTFARQFDLDGWFDNIVDIISYFAQSDVLHNLDRGSWASWSDAGVLEAIQNGHVMYEGGTPVGESGGAAAKWDEFFRTFPAMMGSPSDLKQYWARAEQAGVNYGTSVADAVVGRPDGLEGSVIHDFIWAGDIYRGLAQVPYGGGKVGGAVGARVGSAVGSNIQGGGLAGAVVGERAGFATGEWFTTPTSHLPIGPGPTYHAARFIEWRATVFYRGR